jgi:outer membrane biogenesis lipoprotein LolB
MIKENNMNPLMKTGLIIVTIALLLLIAGSVYAGPELALLQGTADQIQQSNELVANIAAYNYVHEAPQQLIIVVQQQPVCNIYLPNCGF